jgi:hypothetical protein
MATLTPPTQLPNGNWTYTSASGQVTQGTQSSVQSQYAAEMAASTAAPPTSVTPPYTPTNAQGVTDSPAPADSKQSSNGNWVDQAGNQYTQAPTVSYSSLYPPTSPYNQPAYSNPAIPTPITPAATTVSTPSSTGLDDNSFVGMMNSLNNNFQQNNDLVKSKNAVIQAMLGNTIDPATMASLPQDVQDMIKGGNRNQMLLEAQVLSDQIKGDNSSFAASVQTLTTGYTNYQSKVTTALNNLMTYSEYTGYPLASLVKAMAPVLGSDLTAQLSSNLEALGKAPLIRSTVTQNTIPSAQAGVSGYDLSTYATDPSYTQKVSAISSSMGAITSAQDAQTYITDNFPSSPITGDMIMNSSTLLGIDPNVLMAQIQEESQMGTSGVAMADNNPAGITWSQTYQDANPGTSKGSARPEAEGGNYVHFATMQDGMNAEADWLAQHQTMNASNPLMKYMTAAEPTGDAGKQYDAQINATPDAVYQDALTYLWQGPNALSGMGLGQAGQVKDYRMAVRIQGAEIAKALGIDEYSARALYKSNASAATQNVQRVARIESISNTMTTQMPRLAKMADQLKADGINLTESDFQAGAASVLKKFGNVNASNYIELLATIRGDYSAYLAAVGGSRGGQHYSLNATQAIDIGLTGDQYLGNMNTIIQSAKNTNDAIQNETRALIGVSGSATSGVTTTDVGGAGGTNAPTGGGSTGGGSYQDYLNAIK